VRHFFPGGISIDRERIYSSLNPALLFDNSVKFSNLRIENEGVITQNTAITPVRTPDGSKFEPFEIAGLVKVLKKVGK
jgi:hypothetical protein